MEVEWYKKESDEIVILAGTTKNVSQRAFLHFESLAQLLNGLIEVACIRKQLRLSTVGYPKAHDLTFYPTSKTQEY